MIESLICGFQKHISCVCVCVCVCDLQLLNVVMETTVSWGAQEVSCQISHTHHT